LVNDVTDIVRVFPLLVVPLELELEPAGDEDPDDVELAQAVFCMTYDVNEAAAEAASVEGFEDNVARPLVDASINEDGVAQSFVTVVRVVTRVDVNVVTVFMSVSVIVVVLKLAVFVITLTILLTTVTV
jgi:hypothetical protein